MKALFTILKLAIVIAISFYLSKMDGYVNIVLVGYYIDMSATAFIMIFLASLYVVWKISKLSSFSMNAPKAYFSRLEKEKQKIALQNVWDGHTAFYNKDVKSLHKAIKRSRKTLGHNHDTVVLMTIQAYVLEGDLMNALIEYRKSISTSIADIAGHILYETNDANIINLVLEAQIEYDVLQGWAFVAFAKKQKTYDEAVAQIDLGEKAKMIKPETALVEKALLSVAFSENVAVKNMTNAWVKTHDIVLLKGFEAFASFMALADYRDASKIMKKDSNVYGKLALSYMSCGAGIWGQAREYLEMASGQISKKEYYKTLSTIELAEKGETEAYFEHLEKLKLSL